MENRHSNSIPPEDVEVLNQKVREINEILNRYANPLTPKERREILVRSIHAGYACIYF
ncbi:MAG: hypothetical protein LBG80_06370 [Bacteroidales bacterium]|jgi:hypothetical protein|nr:hypothetical protein [Bacteroidales bacterium]